MSLKLQKGELSAGLVTIDTSLLDSCITRETDTDMYQLSTFSDVLMIYQPVVYVLIDGEQLDIRDGKVCPSFPLVRGPPRSSAAKLWRAADAQAQHAERQAF